MITKGYIISKSKENSNKYLVRIPIFESTGVGVTLKSLNSSISECTLCYNPGTYEGLKRETVYLFLLKIMIILSQLF
jgi:hypothetical protein